MEKEPGAYYKNKTFNFEVYTLEDLKEIETLPNLPYKVKIMNDIEVPERYEVNEESKRIENIETLLKKAEELENKAFLFAKSKKALEEIYYAIYCELLELDYEKFSKLRNRDKIKEELKALKSPIRVTDDLRPINLQNRTEQLFISGNGHIIKGLNISKGTPAALFVNVDCDLTINNLDVDITIDRAQNAALLVSGQDKEDNEHVLELHNVHIYGEVKGSSNISQFFINWNGRFIGKRLSCNIYHNDECISHEVAAVDEPRANYYKTLYKYTFDGEEEVKAYQRIKTTKEE